MYVFLWIFQIFFDKQYCVVVYSRSVKYWYEIPNKYLSGSMAISLLAYVAIFSDSFIFGKATFSQFLRVTFLKVSQELLFWSSFLLEQLSFEQMLFLRSPFFKTVTFFQHFFPRISTCSERNFYPETNPWEQEILYCSYLSEQLPTEDSYRRATFSKQILLHNINFFFQL